MARAAVLCGRMRRALLSIIGALLLVGPTGAHAQSLLYRYKHFLFNVTPSASWHRTQDVWTFHGHPFIPPPSLLVDGDGVPPLPDGMIRTQQDTWDRAEIAASLALQIGDALHRDPGKVTIRTASGKIVFDGVGLTGRDVDFSTAADLTVAALEQGVSEIMLPVSETQPELHVDDPALVAKGIREVVTIGESNFSNSPSNRRHNIAVGLGKFNGTLIPSGTVFSFDKTLGRVDASTGYLEELVIKGDQTIPDYGGGLCQVSTTAYRGVWEYGFPIVKRINHSYQVSHYFPQGTDATVYPPNVDMQFKNDSSGALLMQTYADGDLAYFIYYGTKDARKSSVFGPYTWDSTPPPPDRTQYTLDLAPGETKKVGERVPGIKAMWYRFLSKDGEKEKMEPVFSSYEARPHYELIGVATMPTESGSTLKAPPTLFMEDQPTDAPFPGVAR